MKPLVHSLLGRPRIIFEDNIKTDISDMDFDQGKWVVLTEAPIAGFDHQIAITAVIIGVSIVKLFPVCLLPRD